MQKIAIPIVLLLVIGLFVLNHFTKEHAQQEVLTDLPWLVKVDEQGRTHVFGQTLGVSTLGELVMHAGRGAELRLFHNRDGSYALEAYLEYVELGNIISRLIVELQAPDEVLQGMQARALKEEVGPSLARKYTLTLDDERNSMMYPVSSLTYTPMYVRLTDEMIEARFGPAQSKVVIDEDTRHLLYPDIGLDIFINARGKSVFQYVNPGEFQRVQENLDAARQRAQLESADQ